VTVRQKYILAPLSVAIALSGITLVQLIKLDVWPFTDLPNHLTEAVIFKNADNPASLISRYYSTKISIAQPTITHVVVSSLFSSVETGNLVCYAAYLLVLPAVILFLIVLCRGDTWLSILSVTFLYNFNVTWGFTGFTLALPIFFMYVAIHIKWLDHPTYPRAALLTLVLTLLYWTHVLLFLFALLCYAVTELTHSRGRRIRKHLMAVLPVIPPMLLLAWWVLSGEEFHRGDTASAVTDYYLHEYIRDFPRRMMHLFNNHYQFASGVAGASLAALFLLGLFAPVLASIRRGVLSKLVCCTSRRVVVSVTMCGLACYAFLPKELPGQAFLFERFVCIFLLGVVVLLACIVPRKFRCPVRVWAIVLGAAYCLLWYNYLEDFGTFVKPFNRVLLSDSGMEYKTMAAIIDEPGFRGRPVMAHFNNYHSIWNGGVAASAVSQYRFGVVGRRENFTLPNYAEWVGDTVDFTGLIKRYSAIDYLLVHGTRPFEAVTKENQHDLVRRADGWALFRTRGQGKHSNEMVEPTRPQPAPLQH
jgi:hypothetical protein